MCKEFINKIRGKWMKLRLQPIRIYCFHHVSDVYEQSYMWEEDWTQIDMFKTFVLQLKSKGFSFISLADAYAHIKNDKLRVHKYAVLTADDGFRTLLNILPWLEEQQVPITLFVNPKYMVEDAIGDNVQSKIGQTKSQITSSELYLKLADIQKMRSPYISFAYHGYEHLDEWDMDEKTFKLNIEKSIETLQDFPNVIPFYAHTYGHVKEENNAKLWSLGLVPAHISGGVNYNNSARVDRILISNETINKLL